MTKFLLGAATSAHQVEGNNDRSDTWAAEHLPHTTFAEPSGQALDHYHLYKEDLKLLKQAGLNAYRFTIEWARIEPAQGQIDQGELAHYREKLTYCHELGLTPIVTLHHFSSPKWVIEQGGWENPAVADWFAAYASLIVTELGDQLSYICTINEANMGLQLADMIAERLKGTASSVQVGINTVSRFSEQMLLLRKDYQAAFGAETPAFFLSPRTEKGDTIIMQAHIKARRAIKSLRPDMQVGLTLSLHDFQASLGGETLAEQAWDKEFSHYLPVLEEDDFLGVQNYTRKVVNSQGTMSPSGDLPLTQMGYEVYPQALEHVLRRVASQLSIPLLVTENGIATADDEQRISFIDQALTGLARCREDGLPILGYLYWSLLDNFEWQKGYSMTFGLIAVDRQTQERQVKLSLSYLGQQLERFKNKH